MRKAVMETNTHVAALESAFKDSLPSVSFAIRKVERKQITSVPTNKIKPGMPVSLETSVYVLCVGCAPT